MRLTARPKGFTLIEIIVTLTLVGLIGAMAIPFFMSGATLSGQPINNLLESSAFRSVMANMVADYNNIDIDTSSPGSTVTYGSTEVVRKTAMVDFQTRIATDDRYGSNYTVTQNSFVLFGNLEQYDALLVTIQSDLNPAETLTHLFPHPIE